MNKMTKIAAAGAIATALALPASQAFAASKTENALIGAAIGALAGGLIGKGDTGAVVAGAAVGGLVGVATDKPDRRYGSRSYRTTSRASSNSYANGYRYQQQPTYRSYYNQPSYGRGYAVPAGYRSYGY